MCLPKLNLTNWCYFLILSYKLLHVPVINIFEIKREEIIHFICILPPEFFHAFFFALLIDAFLFSIFFSRVICDARKVNEVCITIVIFLIYKHIYMYTSNKTCFKCSSSHVLSVELSRLQICLHFVLFS